MKDIRKKAQRNETFIAMVYNTRMPDSLKMTTLRYN